MSMEKSEEDLDFYNDIVNRITQAEIEIDSLKPQLEAWEETLEGLQKELEDYEQKSS